MTDFDLVFFTGLIASFLLGLLASYLFWFLTAHYWTPRIKFSDELAEYHLPESQNFVQCAFQNSGKREIIDVEIIVRIGIFGFKGASVWAYHTVKSNASRVPMLGQTKHRRVRIFDTRTKIQFDDIPSKSLRDELEKAKDLRAILHLGEKASIRIHVFGYDAFSGTRKHFKSKPYELNDLRIGTFSDLNVVQNKRFSQNQDN